MGGKEPADEQEDAVAAEDSSGEQRQVAGEGQVGGQHQGLGEERVKEVIGVEDEVDAKRVPDEVAVQRAAEVVDEGGLEIPGIPQEGGFVEGPLGNAGNGGSQSGRQRPRENQRQQGIEGEDD